MEDEELSVTIDIPKPRVCTKLSKDIFKAIPINKIVKKTMENRLRKPSESSIQKYTIPRDLPLPLAHFKREELLIPYKMFNKMQLKDNCKQKLAVNLLERHKIISTDLKKRLFVERPLDDVHALTDVDKSFFKYVSGRPLVDRAPLFKSLKAAVADLLRIRQDIGCKYEAILNFEVNNKQEQETYNLSLKRYMKQVKCFDDFISEDYKKSMSFLDEWEQLKTKLHNKICELENIAAVEFTVISRLMGLDYLYRLQQKYGRFLYYLSPPSWRGVHRDFAQSVEIEAKGFDLGVNSEEDTFNVLFEKMQQECGNFVKPVLYFTHPDILLNIFDGIEKQQLHHFSYITHLAPPKKMVKEGIKCLKDIINHEGIFVVSTIKRFETLLEFSIERCEQLKSKFLTILHGLFYESVGAPAVLKLFVHLEFCYERVFGEKALNMDIVAMAKALERCYMVYTKGLDDIHSDTVKQAVAHNIALEKRKMRKARLAARELREFDRLVRDLLRAHEPPGKVQVQPLTKLTKHKLVKRNISKAVLKISDPGPMNESELEYLRLFTDWAEGDDPDQYLHRIE